MNRSPSLATRLVLAVLVVAVSTGACGGNSNPHDAAAADTGDDRPSTADARDGGDAIGGGDATNGGDATGADGGTCQPPVTQDGTCNSIALRGSTIRSTCSTAPTPVPSGGSIEDGTYVLDAMTFYGTCPATADQQRTTWVVCGGSWQVVEEVERTAGNPDAGLLTERVGVSMTKQPTSLMGNVVCWFAPGTGPATVNWGYDATPGRLSLYIPIAPGVRVDSFTRQ